MSTRVAEWAGSLFGLMGAFLLARHDAWSGYGFVAFLISNGCWIYFGIRTKTYGLLVMQAGFTLTSILGIQRWLS